MLSDIRVLAPAKVNIGLNVLPARSDGFHDIESIFQTVKLADVLDVSFINENGNCILDGGDLILPTENTFSKTYDAFCDLTGCRKGVFVKFQKVIPMGGGLGGGSSDAASFLKALAYLNKVELTNELSDAVASQVGSDVFFFLHCGEDENGTGCAVVTGRGDIVKAIKPRSDLYFVLIFPNVHSSTKEAYGLLDDSYESGKKTSCPKLADLEYIYRGSVSEWSFINSFTSVLVQKYPVIGKALQDIKNTGALWSDMSGSGATVFGVYSSKEECERAFVQLRKSWIHCVIA